MTPAEFSAWRKRLGLTQAEAGAMLGVARRTVQQWEQAVAKVPAPVEKLCAFLAAAERPSR